MEQRYLGKTLEEWSEKMKEIHSVVEREEYFWVNPIYKKNEEVEGLLTLEDVKDAEDRLNRFKPYIVKVFPETLENDGLIESPTVKIPYMKHKLKEMAEMNTDFQLLLKCDNQLPISGSIKARGGIYQVLKIAEEIAIHSGLLSIEDNYAILAEEKFKNLFSNYSISVGSTGNLGLSIGIMSAKLGFNAIVHMSSDAKQWKKELLRRKGVKVVEYPFDYSVAISEGRKQALNDDNMYFIDDENSHDLFLGYAVAAFRLKKQLDQLQIKVDKNHPLFVYLPCGVGGGPGGVTFGLKLLFKEHVHCLYAEPTHSPAMLLGLATGLHENVSVQDFGIDNRTEADGLAVGRPSGFVGRFLEKHISGVFTVEDKTLYKYISTLMDCEAIALEPSAVAGFAGPINLLKSIKGQHFLEGQQLKEKLQHASHLVWATGGNMVPKEVQQENYLKGKKMS